MSLFSPKTTPEASFNLPIVMHSCYHILKYTNCKDYFKTPMSKTALLFGSLMHDVDHSGKNNGFMIKAMSPMARRYNDVHVRTTYKTLFNLILGVRESSLRYGIQILDAKLDQLFRKNAKKRLHSLQKICHPWNIEY